MGSIMASLLNSSDAMRMFQRGMEVVQNNVSNANTPGYAKQRLGLMADRFQPETGLTGGVSTFGNIDSRDAFADRTVRRRLEQLSSEQQRAALLSQLEPVLQIQEGAGISGALTKLWSAFSGLTVSPNDPGLRQAALDQASRLAESFRYTSASLGQQSAETDRSIIDTVSQLNYLATRIAALNHEFRNDYRSQQDAGLNAQMANLLEQVSEIADTNVVRQADGSVTVYLGDQSLLVVGDHAYSLTTDTSGTPAVVLDPQGMDVGPSLSGGKLYALLQFRNVDIPSYKGQLDRLAQSVADEVNTLLSAGLDQSGQPPGVNLFTYDTTVGAAATLAVNAMTPDQLALASVTAPGGNGNALALSQLDRARPLDGFTFQQFFGNIAAQAGRALSTANANVESNNQLVAQARTWRDEISRVDLNEEAAMMIEYQRSFEAAARMVTVLNEMTETLINIIR